jgi:Pvc16 N-terminal domain
MATYPAIAITGQAILKLLADSCPRAEFGAVSFELFQVGNFSHSRQMDEGISLFLYRLGVNAARRNLPSHVKSNGLRYRPPLPLDLYYLLTAWGKSAAKQQRLLGWAMRVLEDTPLLPSGLLNDVGPEPEIFQPNETVEIIYEPLSLQDMYNIWSVLKASPQLSASYVVRAVSIDSTVLITEAAPVQTRALDFGEANQQ